MYLLYAGLALDPVRAVEDFTVGLPLNIQQDSATGPTIAIKNNGGFPMAITFRQAGTSGAWAANITGPSNGWIPSVTTAPLDGFYFRGLGSQPSIAAGATAYYQIAHYWDAKGTASSGSYDFTIALQVRATYSLPSLIIKEKSVSFTKNGICNVGTGSLTVTPANFNWGLVQFDALPAFGRINLVATQPISAGKLFIGTQTIPFTSLADVTWTWSTTLPATYTDGLAVRIMNGPVILGDATIVKDSDGNFDITFLMDAAPNVDGSDSVDYVPPFTWAQNNPDITADATGSQVTNGGRTPAPLPGVDPADSPAGSAANEMYKQMRAGVRDALNEDVNTGAAPDFTVPDDVRGVEGGKKIVEAMGKKYTVAALAKPTVGTSGLTVSFYGIASTIVCPSWLSAMRPWFDFLINILGVMGLIKMTKVALA